MGIPIETIQTKSFSMDYIKFGQGKDTLVILPGLSVQSVMRVANAIARDYRTLADDFTVYLFDRRKEIPGVYTVHDMARDTAEAIRTLGLEQINLFGASQGGMIAQVIAIQHPELVRRLVLGSTSACVDDAGIQEIEKWVRYAKAGDSAGLYLAFGEAIYSKETFEQFRKMLTEIAETVTEAELKRFVVMAEGSRGFDVTSELEGIRCPVLVLGSRDDRVLGGAASEVIARHLGPRAELFMYDGYGHAAYDMAPDYKQRILRFLTAQEEIKR